jgi:hypothetical protein
VNAPNHADLYRGLGEVEGRLGALESVMNQIRDELRLIRAEIELLKAAESQRKGAMGVLAVVASAIGGIAAMVAEHFWR